MKSKKSIILILTIIALAAFGLILWRGFLFYPSDEVPLPPGEAALPEDESPLLGSVVPIEIGKSETRIVIPAIEVDAKIIEVGITGKGNMAAPKGYSDVGWYKYGTKPGALGSSVMAGHVDNGLALPAVFYDLEDLQVGDDLYIRNKEGAELHFKVTGHTVYPYNAAPKEVFYESGGRFLKLITCVGSRIKEIRTRENRLVVKAELVE